MTDRQNAKLDTKMIHTDVIAAAEAGGDLNVINKMVEDGQVPNGYFVEGYDWNEGDLKQAKARLRILCRNAKKAAAEAAEAGETMEAGIELADVVAEEAAPVELADLDQQMLGWVANRRCACCGTHRKAPENAACGACFRAGKYNGETKEAFFAVLKYMTQNPGYVAPELVVEVAEVEAEVAAPAPVPAVDTQAALARERWEGALAEWEATLVKAGEVNVPANWMVDALAKVALAEEAETKSAHNFAAARYREAIAMVEPMIKRREGQIAYAKAKQAEAVAAKPKAKPAAKPDVVDPRFPDAMAKWQKAVDEAKEAGIAYRNLPKEARDSIVIAKDQRVAPRVYYATKLVLKATYEALLAKLTETLGKVEKLNGHAPNAAALRLGLIESQDRIGTRLHDVRYALRLAESALEEVEFAHGQTVGVLAGVAVVEEKKPDKRFKTGVKTVKSLAVDGNSANGKGKPKGKKNANPATVLNDFGDLEAAFQSTLAQYAEDTLQQAAD